ncbi:LysE family translocator [Acinetobacter gerneri]|jgi:threonine/homoserine/homoserine lactone efflux protein|uniref:LysE family translocator n=1 Tax=Acinetobacter gerneri TaxID=202952 RepID=UPI0023F14FF7|nr:LysE family translocator [Acinetobacter gerneri]MCH4242791.1 LysE family translocator [Acinetobacter gerneri]
MLTFLIPYLIAVTLLTLTPGLDTALIIRTATVENKQTALKAALGINLGCILWGILVAFGVATILQQSIIAFTILKWCGAAYLAWIGIKLLIHPQQHIDIEANLTLKSNPNWFLRGLFGNLLNPKIGIFYISFLPQFVPTHATHPSAWIMFLVFLHVFIGFTWCNFLIFFSQKLNHLLKSRNFIKNMDRVTGIIFFAFAIKLVFSKR